jgi:hypothetical protein
MSDPHLDPEPAAPRMSAGSLGRSALARPLHGSRALVSVAWFVLVPLAIAGGCVIPPDLSVADGDAGVNSPPAILALRRDQQELPEPGPVNIERGTGSISVTLLDTDTTDKLYVRVFVDYKVTDPTPARSTCTAPPNGTVQRTVTCDLSALCQQADVGAERLMQIQVFDREPLETGTPPFKAMQPGGLTTSRIYQLQCTEMTQ